jgi:hypothetical protein
MSEHELRYEITPEPDDDELVAILEVVRGLIEPSRDEQTQSMRTSNWGWNARQEGLRPPEWGLQRASWATGQQRNGAR